MVTLRMQYVVCCYTYIGASDDAYFEIGFIWHINVALSTIRFGCWTFTQCMRFWIETSTPWPIRFTLIAAVVIIFCRANMLRWATTWRWFFYFHFVLLFMPCVMRATRMKRACMAFGERNLEMGAVTFIAYRAFTRRKMNVCSTVWACQNQMDTKRLLDR